MNRILPILLFGTAALFALTQSVEAKTINIKLISVDYGQVTAEQANPALKCAGRLLGNSRSYDFRIISEVKGEIADLYSLVSFVPINTTKGVNLGWAYTIFNLISPGAGTDNEQKLQIFRDLKQMSLPRTEIISPAALVHEGQKTCGTLPPDTDFSESSRKSICQRVVDMIETDAAQIVKMAEWAQRNIGNEVKGEK